MKFHVTRFSRKQGFRLIPNMVVLMLCLIWLTPTLGLFITSLRPPSAISDTGWWTILPRFWNFNHYTLENFQQVIAQQGMGRAFLNSLYITLPATLMATLIAALAGFGFAWLKFTGRRPLFALLIVLMVVPLQMTFIPILPIYNRIGLSGTFAGIWLAHTAYGLPLTVFLLHRFIADIPSELIESALIDGASAVTIFCRIILPLAVPALASVFIFQFLWIWNDLLVALIYLGGSPAVSPLTLQVANLVTNQGQNWELLTAAAFMSMILPLAVFLILQRFFVKGILAGSIKG